MTTAPATMALVLMAPAPAAPVPMLAIPAGLILMSW